MTPNRQWLEGVARDLAYESAHSTAKGHVRFLVEESERIIREHLADREPSLPEGVPLHDFVEQLATFNRDQLAQVDTFRGLFAKRATEVPRVLEQAWYAIEEIANWWDDDDADDDDADEESLELNDGPYRPAPPDLEEALRDNWHAHMTWVHLPNALRNTIIERLETLPSPKRLEQIRIEVQSLEKAFPGR